MPNFKKPFIYTLEHKMNGTPQTTATVLANNGVHQLTGASTWVIAQPRVGSLVTIYAAASMSTRWSGGPQTDAVAVGRRNPVDLCRGVAKLVKASDFDSDMRRFESFLPCQIR